jgi:nucleotide-binding universal stress UspA family protein
VLLRDLRAWAGPVDAGGKTTLRVSPAGGAVDARLTALAAGLGIDLIVVGTHRRAGVARLWHGSVSRGVLYLADTNVACIPAAAGAAGPVCFRRVLVPTDFSALANRAIPYAYALVSRGGVVHLLHVETDPGEGPAGDARERLLALVPVDSLERGIETVVEVTREPAAAAAIVHQARRIGVDAICMGTHGRSRLAGAVLGTQAQAVVHQAGRPVLLVPAERE